MYKKIPDSEARIAREIQQSLLPKIPQYDGFDIGASMHPLNAAGGDFFDLIPMSDGSLGIVIGDVSGHGVGPALLMATTRAYLRVLTKMNSDIGQVITRLNKMLCEDMQTRFITLFFARLDLERRTLDYIDAGHGMCWKLHRSGDVMRLGELGEVHPPLGMLPDWNYCVSASIKLEAGDSLFLATDGLTECTSSTSGLFGFAPVIEIIRENQERPAQDIIGTIFCAAHYFLLRQGHDEQVPQVDQLASMDGFHRVVEKFTDVWMTQDDMTAVLIKVEAP